MQVKQNEWVQTKPLKNESIDQRAYIIDTKLILNANLSLSLPYFNTYQYNITL